MSRPCSYAAVRAYDLAWPSFHLLRFRCGIDASFAENLPRCVHNFHWNWCDACVQFPLADQPSIQKPMPGYVAHYARSHFLEGLESEFL
jgi:hypothetical protein